MTRSSSDYPALRTRLYSVWLRHFRVYTKNLFSNCLPPFLEPLLFLAGVGLGLGRYITGSVDGLRYLEFIGTGLLVTASMFTATFECTFGTFIRLEFGKVYDGMLAAPLTVKNLIVGEILWAGTKGFFFSLAVACVLMLCRVVPFPQTLAAPLVGFLTGTLFATLALLVTSYVKTIHHFNFFLTGVISPMFFFSGVVFPLSDMNRPLRMVAELVPLTHCVRLVRGVCAWNYPSQLWWDLLYVLLFITIVGACAVRRLGKRLID